MESELHDARKRPISMTGYALFQWGFGSGNIPVRSLQMPESIVDLILTMRDEHEHTPNAQAEIERLRSALHEALDHADYFSAELDHRHAGLEPADEDRCDRLCELRELLPNEPAPRPSRVGCMEDAP